MIWIARHAPTLVSGVCYGRTDVACSVDAPSVAEQLRAQLGLRPSKVWSSPSTRCLAPAKLLATRLGVELAVDARLAELDFGEWEGRTWASIEQTDADRLAAWMADWKAVAPPAGETPNDLEARVGAWLRELDAESEHVVVGHAGVIRALSVLCEGVTWDEAMRTAVPHLAFRRFAPRA